MIRKISKKINWANFYVSLLTAVILMSVFIEILHLDTFISWLICLIAAMISVFYLDNKDMILKLIKKKFRK